VSVQGIPTEVNDVRFEVFTAIMKNSVVWNATPCGLLSTDISEEYRFL
jgi:hypothetical protein